MWLKFGAVLDQRREGSQKGGMEIKRMWSVCVYWFDTPPTTTGPANLPTKSTNSKVFCFFLNDQSFTLTLGAKSLSNIYNVIW